MNLLWTGIVASALLTILVQSALLPWPALAFVTKPLATLLLIVLAARRGWPGQARRRAVLVGLCLSLAGDVALLWPQRGFLPGLVAFLLAHLAFLVAFTRGAPLAGRWWPFAGYALVAGTVLWALWPGVPEPLRLPVFAYVVCLAAMAAQACVQWLLLRGKPDGALLWRAALGGALFMLSDALLAVNRFATPLPLAGLWILASYWAAQSLIATSLPPRR